MMAEYIDLVSVSVMTVTVNHVCGIASVTAKTQNAVSEAVSITTVTEECGFDLL